MKIAHFGRVLFGYHLISIPAAERFAFRINGEYPIEFRTDSAYVAYKILWGCYRSGDYWTALDMPGAIAVD